MMLINPHVFSNDKVLELLFNGANGSTIIDSTGRHSPSLSPSGTRSIVDNKLLIGGGGYIRADAINTSSSDFNFGAGDFSVECTVTASSSSTYIWMHTAQDDKFGMCLRMSDYEITLRSYTNYIAIAYNSESSLIGVTVRVKVARTAGRTALLINDVEVGYTLLQLIDVGDYGFIIGAYPPVSYFNGTIDDFIVKKA